MNSIDLLSALIVLVTASLGLTAWVIKGQNKFKLSGGSTMAGALARIDRRLERIEDNYQSHIDLHLKDPK